MKKKLKLGIIAGLFSIIGCCNAFAATEVEIPPKPFTDITFDTKGFIVDPFDSAQNGAEVWFPYSENKVYRVYTQVGYVTDIVLEKNEKITYVGGGDTVRWKLDTSTTGNAYNSVCHIYVKPLVENIIGDVIINTNKRAYRLMLVSAGRYNPVIRWSYDGFSPDGMVSAGEMSKGAAASKSDIRNYNELNMNEMDFRYRWNEKDAYYAPFKIFRSKYKTYIQMKPDIINTDLPSLYVIDDENNRNLVSYRYIDGCFVVDRLFDKAVLLVGKKKKIDIVYKGKGR